MRLQGDLSLSRYMLLPEAASLAVPPLNVYPRRLPNNSEIVTRFAVAYIIVGITLIFTVLMRCIQLVELRFSIFFSVNVIAAIFSVRPCYQRGG